MKEMDTEKTLDWYESNAGQYAKNIEDKVSPQQIKDFAKILPKGGRVLDAGCAAGRDVELLTREGLFTIGIDLSKNLLDIAKQKNPTCDFVYGTFLNMPFESDSFDGLWSHNSLVHLKDKNEAEKAVSEFSRVLKPGGWIHFFVKAQMGTEKTKVKKDIFSNHERFFRYYTESEVKEILVKNNFRVESLERIKETDFLPNGRPDEDMIIALAQKK